MSRQYYAFQDIDNLPAAPSAEEERRLFREYRERRTPQRREHIVRCYLRFALLLARRDLKSRPRNIRERCGLSEDDAISAANLGLMIAIERYNPERGFRFTTYATHWIWKHLLQARYGAQLVRVTERDRRLFSQIVRLQREKGLTDENLSEVFGITTEEIVRLLQIPVGRTMPLDALLGVDQPDESRSRENSLPLAAEASLTDEHDGREAAQQHETRERMLRCLEALPELTRRVVSDHYLGGLRRTALARKYSLRPEALDRILQDGLAALRRKLET